MKTSFFKLLLVGASALAGLGFATSAQANLAPPTAPSAVYSFSGNCLDCAQVGNAEDRGVTGTLTLQSFTPGGAVSSVNFYSLSYGGSNMFDAFTAYGSDVISAGGFGLESESFPSDANDKALNFFVTFSIFVQGVEDRMQVFFETKGDGSFRLGWGDGWVDPGDGPGSQIPQQPSNDFGDSAGWTLAQRNSVPEPGSLLLVGAALVAVGVARRRRV